MSHRPELLELLLSPLSAIPNQFKVTVTQSPAGEGSAESSLPFVEADQDWRSPLIRTLELASFKPEYFTTAEQDWMVKAQLLAENRQVFHPNLRKTIGQVLYCALIPPNSKVERLLNASIQIARTRGMQLLVQLKFEADVVQVARLPDYPWELIHDGIGFLLHNQVGFSRYIAFPAVPPSLPTVEQVNVLLISSSASDRALGLKPLPKKERAAIAEALKAAIKAQRIRLEELPEPTLDELAAYLTQHQGKDAPHLLHFDGHGLFGKQCTNPECRTIHKGIKVHQCRNCTTPLPEAQGYLLFEDEYGDPDYVSASQLGTLLQQTRQSDGRHQTGGVAALVLSACQSGMAVEGESVFQGTAQNLIYHSVPAVVAMQHSVTVEAALAFAKQFYRSIGEKNSLAVAVSQGRAMMRVDENQWYRPVLYLRWRDNEGGQLFAEAKPSPELRIGVPFQAPPLPSYYVARPEVSQVLKTRLLQPQSAKGSAAKALMVSAIHGLGAIGKSTVATALAHDSDVRQYFSDGILWAILGQQPNILSLLGGWIQALGDHNFKGTTVEASTAHLRTLLQEKVALLVVDDAWDASHAQAFLVGGVNCQVLITSRDKLIATSVGASLYSLDVMSPEQSLQLLTQRLGRSLTAVETPQAEALADEVGHLPLALELAAAQVVDGIVWTELLQDLRSEVAYLEALELVGAEEVTDEVASKRISLRKSLNLSIRRLTNERRQNFAWFGILPEDVMITSAMATTLWSLPERNARDTLRYLRDKAILLDGIPLEDGTATYRLHDMFHDLAKHLLTVPPIPGSEGHLAGLGLTLPMAHGSLLNRYRQKTQKQQWHTLPKDSYIHEHLIWHLKQAGWIDEIHALLGETTETGCNGWYEARDRLGQTAGYITDIHQAWALADEAGTKSLSPQIMGWQCRYALIIASLNSVSNIPSELLVALVKAGLPHGWTVEQGLTYSRQASDLKIKAISLALLSEKLPPHLQKEALSEALTATQAIGDGYDRVSALESLADKLPNELMPQALTAAQTIAAEGRLGESARSNALVALADKLPNELLPQALAAAQAIEDEDDRYPALAALADKMPWVWPQALAAAQAIENESPRSKALVALAEKLPPELLPQALATAQAIGSGYHRSRALAALANKLPEVWSEALAAAQAIRSESDRAGALVALADKLPLELLPQALETAQAIEDQDEQYHALVFLVAKLPEVCPQALEIAQAIKDEYNRYRALEFLADKMPEVLPQVLAAFQALNQYQGWIMESLADKLPTELLPEAITAVQAIENEEERSRALVALADKLPTELSPQALAIAQAIEDKKERAGALVALANSLPPELLPQVIAVVQVIGDKEDQFLTLVALANKAPNVLTQVLAVAQATERDEARAVFLIVLATELPEVWPQALESVQVCLNKKALSGVMEDMNKEEALSNVLLTLAVNLPSDLLPQALKMAQAIEDEKHRSVFLAALTNKLPSELLPQALKIAQAIRYEVYRVKALAALADKLPEILPQTLAAAQAIEKGVNRSEALVALADKLPEIWPQALAAVQEIRGNYQEYYWSKTLVALANKLPPELLPQALEMAQAIEREGYRSDALSALAVNLPPELLPQALEMAQAIEDEGYRSGVLMALSVNLPPELLLQALEMAQAIEYEACRLMVLVFLDFQLPKILPQALAAAQAIENGQERAVFLEFLIAKLPLELLPQALAAAQAIENERYRAITLVKLFPHFIQLPTSELGRNWAIWLGWLAMLQRAYALHCLTSLVPIVDKLGGRDAVAAIADAINDVCHWWR